VELAQALEVVGGGLAGVRLALEPAGVGGIDLVQAKALRAGA
jgi:hypothetical protein